MKRLMEMSLFAVIAFSQLQYTARAVDGSWSNDLSGNWSNPVNWIGGGVATGTDATAYFTNAISSSRTVTNDFAGTLGIGNLYFAPNGANAWALNGGTVGLSVSAGSPAITVASGNATIGSMLSGSAGFTKAGAGALTMGATNIYSGATIVSAGTLRLSSTQIPTNGLAVWYDASSLVGFTNGQQVSYLPDLSGNNNYATQAVAGAAATPTFKALGLNGRGVVLFNANSQGLWSQNNIGITGNMSRSLFVVMDRLSSAGVSNMAVAMGSNQIYRAFGISSQYNNLFFPYQYAYDLTTAARPVGVVELYEATHDQATSNGVSYGYINGSLIASATFTNDNTADARFQIGFRNTDSQQAAGDFAEVLAYNRLLSAAERQQVEAYLMYKWLNLGGIATNIVPTNSPLQVAAAGTFDLNGTFATVGSLADSGGSGGTVTNSGSVGATLRVGADNSTQSFSGNIGGALTFGKVGTGTQYLYGTNTFNGGVVVNSGTLSAGANINLGQASGGIVLNGGTLQLTGSWTNGLGNRLLTISSGSSLDVTNAQTYTLSNAFNTCTGALTKAGTGTLVINQFSANNNWSGPLTINGGSILALGNSGDYVIRNNVTINNGGTFKLGANNIVINTSVFTINAGGIFDMGGWTDCIGFLAGGGLVTNNSAGLVLDLGTATNTFSGSIGGSSSLTMRGANGGTGMQVLSGVNTFSGGVILQSQTLSVGADANLGATGGAVTFQGGALQITGTTLTNLDTRPVNWTTFNGTFDINNAANIFTITNVISGTGVVTKTGAGKLVLASSNTYSGATIVNAGTLDIGVSGGIVSTQIVVAAGATLLLENNGALATNANLYLISSGTTYPKIYLTNGVVASVNLLLLNGATLATGTWGNVGSGAQNINTNLFAGAGVLNVALGISSSPIDGSWAQNANGDWGVMSNWVNNVVAVGANATAYFTNALTADRTANNTYGPLDLGNLVFGSPTNNWTIISNAINLTVSAGTPTITVVTNTATISSTLIGTQGMAKAGGGTLVVPVNHTYSGPTAINQSTVLVNNVGSFYNNGGATGTINVNTGGVVQFNRNDTFGNHPVVPVATVTINAGGLVQNGAYFNTFKDTVLNGGELRANGGANANFQAYQLKGSVTVTGSIPSKITANSSVNAINQIQLGNNTTNGITTFNVADVTGDANPDLNVSASFINGMPPAGGNSVPSGLTKSGDGTLMLNGSSVNTGPSSVNQGALVISGGVYNAALNLANGTTLTAMSGMGLVGEYYYLAGVLPVASNFNSPQNLSGHLGTTPMTMAYNYPIGNSTNFDFGTAGASFPMIGPMAGVTTYFEGRWRGKFIAPTNGIYQFDTSSDDGSMLWVDGMRVVNNNFAQGISNRTGTISLNAGTHDIEIDYYQGTGGYGFFADVTLPGSSVSNRIANTQVISDPAIGSLSGATGSTIILSNTTLTVSQTTYTNFDGTITGVGALRKLGTNTLILTGPNYMTNTILGAGRLSISNDASIGGPTGPLTFDGGLLQITGTAINNLDTHSVNWTNFVGGFDIADPANTFTITNDIIAPSTVSSLWKFGPGTLPMIGNILNIGGSLSVQGGTLSLGNNTMLVATNGMMQSYVAQSPGTSATLLVPNSATVNLYRIGLGAGANAAGAIVQNGGFVLQSGPVSADTFALGYAANGYGYYQMNGGLLSAAEYGIGSYANGHGILDIFGGVVTARNYFIIGRANGNANQNGVVNVFGGTLDLAGMASNFGMSWNGTNLNIFSMLNVGGTGFLNAGGKTLQELNGANNTSVVNLASGGTLKVGQITGGNGVAMFNFNGGTLQAGASSAAFMQGLSNTYLYANGGVFDTLTNTITVAQPLLAPLGNGVLSLLLTNNGTGYRGPPIVKITGDGRDATAIAQVDLSAGTITNLLVTSAGFSFTNPPSVAFIGGGGTGAGVGTVTLTANTSGGLTKLGSGALVLTATNTYGGATTISNGTILVSSTNAIPGAITLASSSASVGPTYPIDQSFINWLTSRLTGGVSPGIITIGANSSSNIDVSMFTNVSLAAANGNWVYNGNFNIGASTNLYLGNAPGTLIYAPNIGTGTNVFIGYNGTTTFPPFGAVQLNGTNASYASTINVVSGTLKGGNTNSLGGASSKVIVQEGTTLDVNDQNLGTVQVYVQGKGVSSNNGAIVNTGAAGQVNALQRVTLTGDTTFGGTSRWDIRPGSLDLGGYTLTKTNANYIGLVSINVTDGNIVHGQGTLDIEGTTSLTGGVGTITVGPAGFLQFWALTGQVTKPIYINGGSIGANTAGAGFSSVGGPITISGATNIFSTVSGSTIVFTGVVSGAGALVEAGAGVIKLAATEAYTGPTIVNGGTLELAGSNDVSGTIGSSSNLLINSGTVVVDNSGGLFGTTYRPITIATGGALTTSNGVTCHIPGNLTLAGGSLASGTPDPNLGSWTLDSNVTVTASGSSINASRVELGNPAGTTFDVTNGVTLAIGGSLEDPGAGTLGTGTVIKTGSGLMALSGSNNYSGATILNNGTIKLGYPLNNLAHRWSFNGNLNDSVGTNTAQIIVGTTTHYTYNANQIVLPGGGHNTSDEIQLGSNLYKKDGTPVTIELWATQNGVQNWGRIFDFNDNTTANYFLMTWSQGTTLTSDRVEMRNASVSTTGDNTCAPYALGTKYHIVIEVIPGGGTGGQTLCKWYRAPATDPVIGAMRGSFSTPYSITNFNAVNMWLGKSVYAGDADASATYDEVRIWNSAISEADLNAFQQFGPDALPGGENLLPTNTSLRLATGTSLDLGGVNQLVGSLSDIAGAGGTVTNSATNASAFAIGNDNANTTFSGPIRDGAGSVALAKIGTGIQTLNGISTFSGGTAISGGSLIVNGALMGTGGVTFTSGTLGGTGIVNGFVINMGGTVAPGASPGRLTILGDYATAGSLDIEIAGNIAGSGYDQLLVGGSASLGGTLNVTLTNYTPVAGDSFTILTASNGLNGTTFGAEILPTLSPPTLGWQVQYLPNSVILSVTSAPTGYDAWAAQIVGTNTAYNQSALDDGYPNLLKYATGSSPTMPDNLANMNAARLGGILQLLFNHDTNATDISLIVEGAYTSTNDATWNGIATNIAGSWGSATNVVENTSTNPASVTVSDTAGPSTNRFLRLRVTRP